MSKLRLDPIQGILAILDRGNTTGTNKFGLLLSLIDLAPYVGADRRIHNQDITLKLIEIHWSHPVPISGAGSLRQVSSGNRKNTTLIQEIEKLREGISPNCQFEQARKIIDQSKWETALTKISAATIKNPIDKLQCLPGSPEPFLYNVEKQTSFITIHEKALEDLIKFGPVLRDIVEFKFVHFVVKNNKKILGNTVDEKVYTHLFGREREMPSLFVRRQLWELQSKRCLYTGDVLDDPALKSKQVALDHVVPWSICKLSQIENFVITSSQTNSTKSNLLIAPVMLTKWSEYVIQNRTQLKEISHSSNWPSDLKQVCDVARALYTHMSESTPVWNSKGGYEPLGLYGQSQAIDCLQGLSQMI